MVAQIKKGPIPLALYPFTSNAKERDYITQNTRSGATVQNDTVMHFTVPGLPFGGSGDSGMGSYHGKAGFDELSHHRADLTVPVSHASCDFDRLPDGC